MSNPRRHTKGRGDCFLGLPMSLLLSMLLHGIVFLPNRSSETGAANTSARLVARLQAENSVRVGRSVAAPPRRSPADVKNAGISRSTVDVGGISPGQDPLKAIAAADDEGVAPNELALAEYRLALGKTIARLGAALFHEMPEAGVLELGLYGIPAQPEPVLEVHQNSLPPKVAEQLREVTRQAVRHTPWPAAWSTQRVRISLWFVAGQAVLQGECSSGSACS